MKNVLAVSSAVVLALALAGCTESTQTRLNPAWSATVPAVDSVSSRTVNVFPFYSKNVTTFPDRVEETGNVLLLFSWSKVRPLPEGVSAPAPASTSSEVAPAPAPASTASEIAPAAK